MRKPQIMYMEYKGDGIIGTGRIGRVAFSKSGKSLYYGGKEFYRLTGGGGKANYFDVETREHYWISGCRKDGNDALYPIVVEIDEDVRQEYWTRIRGLPSRAGDTQFRSLGKYRRG